MSRLRPAIARRPQTPITDYFLLPPPMGLFFGERSLLFFVAIVTSCVV
jgi:hypothetical protein